MKHMADRAKQAGSSIQDAIHDTATSAEHMAKRAGDAVESAADHLRDRLPKDSAAGEAADTVVRKVKETSVYLQEQGIGGVVEFSFDVTRSKHCCSAWDADICSPALEPINRKRTAIWKIPIRFRSPRWSQG
ncbi:MAG TPA: hypothetical protein PKD38_10890 [Nitrospira sp.]|nr:hypothetical protein [Nitrospira sp.]